MSTTSPACHWGCHSSFIISTFKFVVIDFVQDNLKISGTYSTHVIIAIDSLGSG